MSSRKPDLIVPEVVAVREDQGQPPDVIPHQFRLRVRCSQQGLVLFRLVISFVDGASTLKTTIYLQITAHSLDSLDRSDYNKANAQHPPCLEHVYNRLNNIQSVTRLQFQLSSGEGIQLVVPSDFDVGNILGDTVRSMFESAESLAAASSFSLYFRHNVLPKDSFPMYQKAISLRLTDDMRKWYKNMLDVKRMYKGCHGKVHEPRYHHDSSPTRERCSSPAPATTASCGSTLPFDTVPRCAQESPPPYDKCLNERQSPRTIPDAAATAIFAESPAGGVAPPEYGDTEQLHTDVLDPSQGVLPYGSDDADKQPIKRKLSFPDMYTTRTGATGVSRMEKMPRYRPVDPDQSCFAQLLELQSQQIRLLQKQAELRDQRIEKLEKHVEALQGQVEDVDKRNEELEGDCSMLEKRQDETGDAIEHLHVLVNELEGKCDQLEESMPDVCEEFNDLKENMKGMLDGGMCKPCEDVAKNIGDCVKAETDEIKRKICQALL
ncbi:hypothetical protein LZ31DRAFT_511286 [Colletotrichum somersetense]|nr:hypothetical protein LZ31DRAFT_511286 [Colletotrichum somersetense]